MGMDKYKSLLRNTWLKFLSFVTFLSLQAMATTNNNNQEGPLRVMLWANPRTLSTVFLKCMSFVEGTQCINEPYAIARVAGPEKPMPTDDVEFLQGFAEYEKQFQAALATVDLDLPKAFNDAECTFQFVKDTLEAPYPDKKLVFCKDQGFGVHGKFNMLPKGYRHTFLIRSPHKIYPSWKRVVDNMMPPGAGPVQFDQMPEVLIPSKLGLGELYDLLQYVTEHIDPKPIVIDADDLQSNPSSIMSQYCQAIGIPFQESMLTWEEGDDITQDWIASRDTILGNKLQSGGYYDEALHSTCFKPLKPKRENDDLPDDVKRCIEKTMPLYDKMYEMRLRP